MIILQNKAGKKSAILYNNAFFLPDSNEVVGLTIGHCVFGMHGKIKGRFFQNTVYNLNGQIVAIENDSAAEGHVVDPGFIMQEAWKLLGLIDNLDCPRVFPLDTWASLSIRELLYD